MKVALVHDWLTNFGGAERVVLEFTKLFPEAPIFTAVYDPQKLGALFPPEKVRPSRMNKIPFSRRYYTKMLSLMPAAFESFDLSGYDLVLSSSSSCAKGVLTKADVPHVSYLHTPMRYAWDLYHQYLRDSSLPTRIAMRRLLPRIRSWDIQNSHLVDAFIANSTTVQGRIKKIYRRDSAVIFPPVNTDFFTPSGEGPGNYFLLLSRFVPYKRVDLAIEAFNKLGKPLVIIGGGSEEKRLRRLAGPSIRFTGRLSDEETRTYYRNCRAFIFPPYEDFGITPLEAQACGRPVIAYGRGGALDTVLPGKTGLFFAEQTPEALAAAVEEAEGMAFNTEAIRAHAEGFSAERFRKEIKIMINSSIRQFKS